MLRSGASLGGVTAPHVTRRLRVALQVRGVTRRCHSSSGNTPSTGGAAVRGVTRRCHSSSRHTPCTGGAAGAGRNTGGVTAPHVTRRVQVALQVRGVTQAVSQPLVPHTVYLLGYLEWLRSG